MRRSVEQYEFWPNEPGRLLGQMALILQAQDGWVNIVPGVPEDADSPGSGRPAVQTPLAALFGSRQTGTTLTTWFPPGKNRATVTVGMLHPVGRFAIRELASRGLALPTGWEVRQDHARRGFLLDVPVEVPNAEVLDWMIEAGRSLCTEALTGRWEAEVYLPVPERSTRS